MLSTVLPPMSRMCATGIVADHAADGASAMRRRIRARSAGLCASARRCAASRARSPGSTRANRRRGSIATMRIHILREVEDDGHVAALASQAGAAAARKNRHRVFARERKGGNHVALMPAESPHRPAPADSSTRRWHRPRECRRRSAPRPRWWRAGEIRALQAKSSAMIDRCHSGLKEVLPVVPVQWRSMFGAAPASG